MRQVLSAVDRLEMTVRDNYVDILERLHASQAQQTLFYQTPSQCSPIANQARKELPDMIAVVQYHQTSTEFCTSGFEQDLAVTRVYRRSSFNTSTSSLLTAAEPETTWSMISGSSLMDVASNIAVLNLTVHLSDAYNEEHYTEAEVDQTALTSPTPSQAEEDPTATTANDRLICHERNVVSRMAYLHGESSGSLEISSAQIISSALPDLVYEGGFPPRHLRRHRLYVLCWPWKLFSGTNWKMYKPDENPLPDYVRWLHEGQRPAFLIRRHDVFDLHFTSRGTTYRQTLDPGCFVEICRRPDYGELRPVFYLDSST